jgi:hypothetical protein
VGESDCGGGFASAFGAGIDGTRKVLIGDRSNDHSICRYDNSTAICEIRRQRIRICHPNVIISARGYEIVGCNRAKYLLSAENDFLNQNPAKDLRISS